MKQLHRKKAAFRIEYDVYSLTAEKHEAALQYIQLYLGKHIKPLSAADDTVQPGLDFVATPLPVKRLAK
jgi:hypothetical protein